MAGRFGVNNLRKEKMKTENLAVSLGDGAAALTLLAKLMPWLAAQRSMEDILSVINASLGAHLAWVVIEQDDAWQIACSGEMECTIRDAQTLLEQLQLRRNQRAWRVICWRRHVGKLLFPTQSFSTNKLQSGILCKLNYKDASIKGYFFLAFAYPLPSLSIIKNVVIILVEKLKDYMEEILVRERAAKEMQRVVTQYKALFDRAPVLMNSFDKSNRCILWNGECERLFGWSINELNQQPDPLALFFPDPEMRQQIRSSINTSPAVDMHEWHPIRRDGQMLTVLWSNILLPDRSILSIGLDITERKKVERQLEKKATIDDLTGCYNRFSMLRKLKEALVQCKPEDSRSHFSLLMLDLDHFKNINDRWGHLTGDAALVHFCDQIREHSDPSYLFGRLGGEEFLILMPHIDRKNALRFSQKIRAALARSPLLSGSEKIPLSFSAGLVFVCGEQTDTSVLLTLADNALYDAKRSGRSKTVVASAFYK
ncbi:diguanylate cyclase (GGDEF domain) with PAS/PAC sensor [Kosakonia radicincitans]|nr:sensor domain-containing diguanylate cyclase [Kosakonia radicincitans]MDD7997251.1 sensor domain-containing diguanylate cyclase [Kosakonia radicincitans]SET54123.1 PAS domain S-box-containing protein/diguanylate cyclase (GGDEF) domain-containing protein [Kosakonia radicincitans]VVT45053.1 diguanylate cyclase (GGDEF domain) with PAS/PAC sensor [Kosakonia radicincitans]